MSFNTLFVLLTYLGHSLKVEISSTFLSHFYLLFLSLMNYESGYLTARIIL